MDLNKSEIAHLESGLIDTKEGQLRELSDLQLALVGGGIGETVL